MDKKEFWAKLDALDDEEQIHQNVATRGHYTGKKQGWAIAWLEMRARKNQITPKTPLHQTAIGSLLLIIVGGLVVAAVVYWRGWH